MILRDCPSNLAMYMTVGRGSASVTTAQALPGKPTANKAVVALVQAGAVAVVLTTDGTTPAAGTGVDLAAEEKVWITGPDIETAKVFAGSASVVEVTYFGTPSS